MDAYNQVKRFIIQTVTMHVVTNQYSFEYGPIEKLVTFFSTILQEQLNDDKNVLRSSLTHDNRERKLELTVSTFPVWLILATVQVQYDM